MNDKEHQKELKLKQYSQLLAVQMLRGDIQETMVTAAMLQAIEEDKLDELLDCLEKFARENFKRSGPAHKPQQPPSDDTFTRQIAG